MIGAAIIGCGSISERHIEGYLRFEDRCKILALCNPTVQKAEDKKRIFGLEDALVYKGYEEMLQREDIQLVSICTPPTSHAEIAIACMRAGKHVLLEKPMAPSLEECDRMLQVQSEEKRYLGIISQNRYVQDHADLKRLLEKNAAGAVRAGLVKSLWHRGHAYYDMWWRGTWEKEGGGCTFNQAIHQIDLLNWMMGKPVSVTAAAGNAAHDNSETEDVSTAVLTYQNGAVVTLVMSLVTHKEEQSFCFFCERADISAPWNVYSTHSTPGGFPDQRPDFSRMEDIESIRLQLPKLKYTGFIGQVKDVLNSIEEREHESDMQEKVVSETGGDRRMASTGADGRLAVEVASAIYESAFTGKTVMLPLTKDHLFYSRRGFLEYAYRFHTL